MVSSYGEQVGLLYVCNLNHPNQDTCEEQHHVPQVEQETKDTGVPKSAYTDTQAHLPPAAPCW